MFDGLSLTFLAEASPWLVTIAILLGVVRMIYKGLLVPRSTVAFLERALQKERENGDRLMDMVQELQAPSKKAVEVLADIQDVKPK